MSLDSQQTDINAFACNDKNSVNVLVWNYRDLDIQGTGSRVVLYIQGIPAERATLTQYWIDSKHSNSYEVWKKMGSPQNPTIDQIAELEKAGQLETFSKSQEIDITNSTTAIKIQLLRQAVSLLLTSY